MTLATLVLLLVTTLSACSEPGTKDQRTRLSGPVFGTFYEITIARAPAELDLAAIEQGVREALDLVDRQMSTYKDDSDLNRLNNAPLGEWVKLPEEIFEVLSQSQSVSRETEGAFDITVGSLVNLWSFGPEARPTESPSHEELQARLAEVGHQYLELDPGNLRARRLRDAFIDLSGVAKGYAVDHVAQYLQDQNLDNFLVNIGGDMIASGQRAADQDWRIGIEVPEDGQQTAHMVLPLRDMSLASSGDYRNYFEEDGRRFSHTIDPRTGEPVQHQLASVSVFHPSNTMADAYATAFMVMGAEATLAFAREQDLPVILIERHRGAFRTRGTPALEPMFEQDLLQNILDH